MISNASGMHLHDLWRLDTFHRASVILQQEISHCDVSWPTTKASWYEILLCDIRLAKK